MKNALCFTLALLLCLALCACNSSNTNEFIVPTDSAPTESLATDFTSVTVSIASVTDKENADDLWLKANEIANNIPVVLAAASEDVKNRVLGGIKELADEYGDTDKEILLVGHGASTGAANYHLNLRIQD